MDIACCKICNNFYHLTVESACGGGILGRKAAKTADEVIFESPGGGGWNSAYESGGDARRAA